MPRRFTRTYAEPRRAKQLKQFASETEKRLWFKLQSSGLGAPFRRQHYIGRRFADYSCVPLKLAVEIDGPTHDLASDAKRDREMALRGYDVLRFSVREMDERFDSVVETIHTEVQLRLLRAKVGAKTGGQG